MEHLLIDIHVFTLKSIKLVVILHIYIFSIKFLKLPYIAQKVKVSATDWGFYKFYFKNLQKKFKMHIMVKYCAK